MSAAIRTQNMKPHLDDQQVVHQKLHLVQRNQQLHHKLIRVAGQVFVGLGEGRSKGARSRQGQRLLDACRGSSQVSSTPTELLNHST